MTVTLVPTTLKPGARCCAESGQQQLSPETAQQFTDDLLILAHPIRIQILTMLAATPTATDDQTILTAVREHYGTVASAVLADTTAGCCGGACCGSADDRAMRQDLYLADELEGLPLKAALASLGCGNPTAPAELRPGEVVLDLGSGGGIDVLLSARRE